MNKLPVSRYCFVCGRKNPSGLHTEFFSPSPGEVETRVNLSKEFEGFPGIIHGGVISALLDEIAGRSQQTFVDRFMVTAQLDIRFRKPVLVDHPYLVRGIAGSIVGRVSKARAMILDEDGSVMAEANGVFVDLKQEQVESMQDIADYWRVYPDEEA